MRIVSVLPSATEIVYALGHGSELVARSEECDYPPEVRNLPAVMRPRTRDFDLPSAAIDARVQSVRSRKESLYELDLPALQRLNPDLLLTQDLCGVCSVTDAEVASACATAGITPRIVSLAPRTLGEVAASLEQVADAIGDAPAGRAAADRFREVLRPTGPDPPEARVAIVEWLDPPILAGLWAPDQARAAGGIAPAVRSGEPGLRTGWEELGELRPDLMILAPCSFSVDRTRREIAGTPNVRAALDRIRPRWGTWLADEAYFSRPGPRLAEGVKLIRDLLRGARPSGALPVERWVPGEPGRGIR
ncbi:MAG: TroA family protein [Thermoplasmata archaeon]